MMQRFSTCPSIPNSERLRDVLARTVWLGLLCLAFGGLGCAGFSAVKAPTGGEQASAGFSTQVRREAGPLPLATAPAQRRAKALVADAAVHYGRRDLLAAQNALRQARQLDPVCKSGLLLEAQIARDLKHRHECVAALEAAVAAHPHSPGVLTSAGKMLLQQGETRSGLAALERAAALAPKPLTHVQELAAAYVELGDLAAAESTLVRAFQQSPRAPELPPAIARICEARGNWQGAEHFYTVALRDEPDNSVWYRQRGRSRYQLGQYEAACADFARCTEELQSAELSIAMLEYADASLRLGQRFQAADIYAAVSRHNPQNPSSRQLQIGLLAVQRSRPAVGDGVAVSQRHPSFTGNASAAAVSPIQLIAAP